MCTKLQIINKSTSILQFNRNTQSNCLKSCPKLQLLQLVSGGTVSPGGDSDRNPL